MTLSGKMNFYFSCNALSVSSLENISLNLSEVSQQYYVITETQETFYLEMPYYTVILNR